MPSLWPITAYCTKFRYILLEWHGLLLRVSKPSIKCVLVFFVFYNRFFDLCWLSPSQSTPLSSGGPWQGSGSLVSVGVCIQTGRGVVDPVQDDEAHAANHDQEAAQQEGSGLERGTVSQLP